MAQKVVDARQGHKPAGDDSWFWAEALEPEDDIRPYWETIPGLPRPAEATETSMTQDDVMAKLRAAFDLPAEDAPAAVEEKEAGDGVLARLRRLFGWPAAVEKKYDPDQPRVPKGDPRGGQWTDEVASPDARGRFSPVEALGLTSMLLDKGGFSYQPFDDYSPKDGFMLSIYPERSEVVNVNGIKDTHYTRYVNRNKDLLNQRDHFLGGWLDTDTNQVWLDVSVRMDSAEEAERACCEHDQLAYWDVKNKKEVRVVC